MPLLNQDKPLESRAICPARVKTGQTICTARQRIRMWFMPVRYAKLDNDRRRLSQGAVCYGACTAEHEGLPARRSSSRFYCIMNDDFDDILYERFVVETPVRLVYGRTRAGLISHDNVSMAKLVASCLFLERFNGETRRFVE